MIGAIIGDVAGSRFERANRKSKVFDMFDKKCRPTDDSIMSLAVAKALLESEERSDILSENAISCMQELGRIYKNAGYGGKFMMWIIAEKPQPYNSLGNGAGMRVGPCGFVAKSLEEAKEYSAMVTKVSHNHPEGMKGAEAVSVSVFLAKSGKSKEEIKAYIQENYYDIGFTLDQIRKDYKFDVTCQGSVPVALEAFFESSDFEDAIRNAISVGGDSDTIAAMTGVIAEAYYGIPEGMVETVIDYLDSREMEILYYFEKKYPSKALDEDGEPSRSIFDVIDDCVDKVIPAGTEIEVDGEFPGGAVHAWVDNDAMKPDFSSFDKPDRAKDAKNLISKAGSGISKTAQRAGVGLSKTAEKAGAGIMAAVKSAKDNADKKKKDSPDGKKSVENKKAGASDGKEGKKKHDKLDDQLKTAVTEYNAAYTSLNDHGTKLFNQRERSIDLLDNVEHLINSIANHPKEFDSDIAEIQVNKKEFRDVCDFAKKELEAAQKSAVGVGAGVAGGMAVASLAPSAAMWIATTFGTASTGTAISTLSGAAATNAALAWLGGGALAAGGGGMAAGNAFLALAGPVGWSIAGATLLTSIVLFASKKIKLDKEKKEEIESVLKNTEQLRETDSKLAALLEKTDQIRSGLSEQYTSGMSCFGKNFMELSDDLQTLLGTIVNNAKALSTSLGEGV